MEAPKTDGPIFRALLRHIFLLPDLPDENEPNQFAKELAKFLEYTLATAEGLFPEDCRTALRQCRTSISNFAKVKDDTHRIDEDRLFALLKNPTAAAIPIYLPHHNAGIVIRWGHRDRRFEAFQLSPQVNAVSNTVGRLRRKFPENSVTIAEDTAKDEKFLRAVAEGIAELSRSEVAGLKPTRKIKGRVTEDLLDASLPNHVFDFFWPFLCVEKSSEKDPPAHASIVKHTRDFVQTALEWKVVIRRSPSWLLLKVVLQQELRKDKDSDNTLYKQFMLLFNSLPLDSACERDLDSQTLDCMRRKIGYRTWKLQHKASGGWMARVASAVRRAGGLLNGRWKRILKNDQDHRAIKLPLFLTEDTQCQVKHGELDKFLKMVREIPTQQTSVVPDPKSIIIQWEQSKLPNISQIPVESPDDDVLNMVMVDQWIEDWLQDFVKAHKNNPSKCSDIKKFAIAYFKRASIVYKGLPDHLSIMYLGLIELWVACDMCAVAAYPILNEYKPYGVDRIALEGLLLRTKRQTERFANVEKYIQHRSSCYQSLEATFGTANCFGSRAARDSPCHQALKAKIDADMKKMRQQKRNDLRSLKHKQKMLLLNHENGRCDSSKCGANSQNTLCERCNNLIVAREMKISRHQEVLPENIDLAWSIVFELQVPATFSAWRDLSFFLQLEVAGHTNDEPKSEYFSYMKTYTPFDPYFQINAFDSKRRICFVSPPAKKTPLCLFTGIWSYRNSACLIP